MLHISKLNVTNNRRCIKKILKKSIKEFCHIYCSHGEILDDIDFYKSFIKYNKNIIRYSYVSYYHYTKGFSECLKIYDNNGYCYMIDSNATEHFDKLNIVML